MPVELGSFDVIIGMDWLRRCHAVIVCDEKLVRIPYRNETLTFQGNESNDGRESRLTIISCSNTKEYMAKGCQIFLAQISAKKEEDKSEGKQLKDVPVVRDFPKVFPEDLPGLPPAQPVEFQIDLIPGAVPGSSIYSKIDLRSGYHQLRVREQDIPRMPFQTRYGHYDFPDKKEHEEYLEAILELLKKEKLYARFLKCEFWIPKVQFLGHVIKSRGIHVDPAKIESIKDWASPKTPTEIRQFLGVKFDWGEKEENAFQLIKQKLCNAPILALPEGSEDFVVYCDASHKGLGAVLMQREKSHMLISVLKSGKSLMKYLLLISINVNIEEVSDFQSLVRKLVCNIFDYSELEYRMWHVLSSDTLISQLRSAIQRIETTASIDRAIVISFCSGDGVLFCFLSASAKAFSSSGVLRITQTNVNGFLKDYIREPTIQEIDVGAISFPPPYLTSSWDASAIGSPWRRRRVFTSIGMMTMFILAAGAMMSADQLLFLATGKFGCWNSTSILTEWKGRCYDRIYVSIIGARTLTGVIETNGMKSYVKVQRPEWFEQDVNPSGNVHRSKLVKWTSYHSVDGSTGWFVRDPLSSPPYRNCGCDMNAVGTAKLLNLITKTVY
ncbi:putative reverse transcriptase domain-containing protein [Tanacetum coccineum]